MPKLDDLPDRRDRAERVRHVGRGNELGARTQEVGEPVEQQVPPAVDRGDLEDSAGLLGQHLPGHDVGVVLEVGDEDLVGFSQVLAPGLPRQVASAASSTPTR
jgi:hypothetical protein